MSEMSQSIALILPESDEHLLQDLKERIRDQAEMAEVPVDPLDLTRSDPLIWVQIIFGLNSAVQLTYTLQKFWLENKDRIKDWKIAKNVHDQMEKAQSLNSNIIEQIIETEYPASGASE